MYRRKDESRKEERGRMERKCEGLRIKEKKEEGKRKVQGGRKEDKGGRIQGNEEGGIRKEESDGK